MDERVGVAAGEGVLERLRAFGEVPVGGALVTPGGGLSTPFLIHLIVRSHEEPISEERLGRALLNGLRQAAQWELATVVLSPLGTGAGNLDAETSARVLSRVVRAHAEASRFPQEVLVAVASAYEEEAFRLEVAGAFPEGGPGGVSDPPASEASPDAGAGGT